MKIQFYGVRGSRPTSGSNTVKYGGNTSCVYVECDNGNSIILDAGTGIAELSHKYNILDANIHILITHNHWDHIQGFPYFKPIYQKTASINIVTGITEREGCKMVLQQMSGCNHPVKYQDLPATITLNTELARKKQFNLNGFSITTQALNHPDGGTAYCLTADNQKIAFVTDNELKPPYKTTTSWDEWVSFINNADVLIHDAQYDEQDMPTKQGWGHSTFDQVAALAMQANVKQLFFISHDPEKTDDQLAAQEKYLQHRLHNKLSLAWAKEGTEYLLNTSAVSPRLTATTF